MKFSIIPVTPFQQNSTLVWDQATLQGAVVDPGGDLDLIHSTAEQNGVTIEKILVTHGHVDHAGAVMDLAEQLNIPIEGPHIDDTFWINRLPEDAEKYGFPQARSFVPGRWLDNKDVVEIGTLKLTVRHCPGHTPGHVIFFHEPSKIAIVGDVLFQGSIGRTDFPKGDLPTLLSSIKNRLWPLGADVAFIPGHGPMSTFGDERKNNPYVGDKIS